MLALEWANGNDCTIFSAVRLPKAHTLCSFEHVENVAAFREHIVRADFREGDEHSNFSVFRVRRFSEWPEPLH